MVLKLNVVTLFPGVVLGYYFKRHGFLVDVTHFNFIPNFVLVGLFVESSEKHFRIVVEKLDVVPIRQELAVVLGDYFIVELFFFFHSAVNVLFFLFETPIFGFQGKKVTLRRLS